MNGVLGSVRPLQGADGTFQGSIAENIMKGPCAKYGQVRWCDSQGLAQVGRRYLP